MSNDLFIIKDNCILNKHVMQKIQRYIILALFFATSCNTPKTLWDLANEKKDILVFGHFNLPASDCDHLFLMEWGDWNPDLGIKKQVGNAVK